MMMAQNHTIEEVRAVKERYEAELMAHANVVGVGIGYKYENGLPTDELAIVVNVIRKKPLSDLTRADIIPAELEGIPVDVQEVGPIKAF